MFNLENLVFPMQTKSFKKFERRFLRISISVFELTGPLKNQFIGKAFRKFSSIQHFNTSKIVRSQS